MHKSGTSATQQLDKGHGVNGGQMSLQIRRWRMQIAACTTNTNLGFWFCRLAKHV